MSNQLYILIGPSGAGKSTTAKFIKFILGPNAVIISSDDIRVELTGSIRCQERNHEVFDIFHNRILNNFRAEKSIIVDATNLTYMSRNNLLKLVGPENWSKIVYLVIDRPLADKIKSGGWRNRIKVNGKSLIEHHHEMFQNNKHKILSGDGHPEITVFDWRI